MHQLALGETIFWVEVDGQSTDFDVIDVTETANKFTKREFELMKYPDPLLLVEKSVLIKVNYEGEWKKNVSLCSKTFGKPSHYEDLGGNDHLDYQLWSNNEYYYGLGIFDDWNDRGETMALGWLNKRYPCIGFSRKYWREDFLPAFQISWKSRVEFERHELDVSIFDSLLVLPDYLLKKKKSMK